MQLDIAPIAHITSPPMATFVFVDTVCSCIWYMLLYNLSQRFQANELIKISRFWQFISTIWTYIYFVCHADIDESKLYYRVLRVTYSPWQINCFSLLLGSMRIWMKNYISDSLLRYIPTPCFRSSPSYKIIRFLFFIQNKES